jgi:hypothetical protein
MLAALAVFRDDLEFNKMMWAETSPSTPLLIREILVCHPVLEDFFSTEENRPEERVLLGLLESPAIKAAKNQTFERLLRSIVRQCIIGIDSRPPLIENPDVVVIEPTPEKLAEIAAAKAAHKV